MENTMKWVAGILFICACFGAGLVLNYMLQSGDEYNISAGEAVHILSTINTENVKDRKFSSPENTDKLQSSEDNNQVHWKYISKDGIQVASIDAYIVPIDDKRSRVSFKTSNVDVKCGTQTLAEAQDMDRTIGMATIRELFKSRIEGRPVNEAVIMAAIKAHFPEGGVGILVATGSVRSSGDGPIEGYVDRDCAAAK